MKFYVGRNAKAVAKAHWASVGDTLGDTRQATIGNNSVKALNLSGDDRS
jgi:hypothetical protein